MRRLGRNFRQRQPSLIQLTIAQLFNQADFFGPLTTSLALTRGTGTFMFTRATTGTVEDFEGLLRTVKAGEARFKGARRVENLAASNTEDLTAGTWASVAGLSPTITNATTVTFTAQWQNRGKSFTSVVGRTYTCSFYATAGTGNTAMHIMSNSFASPATTPITLTGTQKRFSITFTATSTTSFVGLQDRNASGFGTAQLTKFLIEDVTGQANQAPAEYVSVGAPVGLVGSELVTNGDFSSAAGWNVGANWAVSGGVANKTAGAQNNVDQAILTVGKNYSLTFTINSISAGQINVYLGSSTYQLGYAAPGTYTFNGTCSGSTSLIIQGSATCVASIDNVSVKETIYHGAGVDGVKCFATQNGNTVAATIVTEAAGAAIPASTLKGIMDEAASTNLTLYSNDLTGAAWTKANCVATANAAMSPDGGTNASALTENGQANPQISQSYTKAASALVYSKRFWTKKGLRDWMQIAFWDGGSYGTRFWFNLATGVKGSTQAIGSNFTNLNYWMEPAPAALGGYYIYVQFTSSAVAALQEYIYPALGDLITGIPVGSALNGNAFYWAHSQLEQNEKHTSYIPTTTAAVTRNADVLTAPNAGNVLDTAGTVYMEATPAFDIPNGTTAGYGYNMLIDFGVTNGQIAQVLNQLRRSDGTITPITPAWVPLKNTTYKIGSRYGSAGQRNWLNGVAGANGAFDGSINSSANMTIGGYGGSTAYNWGGTIKNLRIYKKELSDATMQRLTA